MRRGTTPTFIFSTPYDGSEIDHGYITFKQGDTTVLDKRLTDPGVTVADKEIQIYFEQSETLQFDERRKAKVQIRLVLTDGKAVASNILEFDICQILRDGEI